MILVQHLKWKVIHATKLNQILSNRTWRKNQQFNYELLNDGCKLVYTCLWMISFLLSMHNMSYGFCKLQILNFQVQLCFSGINNAYIVTDVQLQEIRKHRHVSTAVNCCVGKSWHEITQNNQQIKQATCMVCLNMFVYFKVTYDIQDWSFYANI